MDGERFDHLSRTLATSHSRRAVLGAFGAAMAGLLGGRAASAAPKQDKPSKCYGGGSHCTNGKQCCSGICSNRVCAPDIAPECVTEADCPAAESDCQVAVCVAGACGVENLPEAASCATGVCDGIGRCVSCLVDDPSRIGQPCIVGEGACEQWGQWVCSEDGRSIVCSAQAGTPSEETLGNGIDDDCDGQIDEAT